MQPSDPPALKPALARGLRVLTVALADSVGPSEWGLQSQMPDTSSDAKDTLDTLFQVLCAPLSIYSWDTHANVTVFSRLTRWTYTFLSSVIPRPQHVYPSLSCSPILYDCNITG